MDSSLRWNDEQRKNWIPAFAGMTSKKDERPEGRAAGAASNDSKFADTSQLIARRIRTLSRRYAPPSPDGRGKNATRYLEISSSSDCPHWLYPVPPLPINVSLPGETNVFAPSFQLQVSVTRYQLVP